MAEVIITQAARQDLVSIEEYVGHQSPTRAQALVEKLIQRIDILENFPQIGPQIPEFDNPDLRQLIESNYRILYRISSEETIYILRFLHSRHQIEL